MGPSNFLLGGDQMEYSNLMPQTFVFGVQMIKGITIPIKDETLKTMKH